MSRVSFHGSKHEYETRERIQVPQALKENLGWQTEHL